MFKTPNRLGAGPAASRQTVDRRRPSGDFGAAPVDLAQAKSRVAAERDAFPEAISVTDHNDGFQASDDAAIDAQMRRAVEDDGTEKTPPKRGRERPGWDEAWPLERGDEQAGASVRVLIVDDEPNLCDISRIGLRSVGIDAVSVGSGAEAVACFVDERFDLVLLDVNMPDGDGWETLERLRALAPGQHVLMVSGQASAAEARRRGALGLLDKPFDLEALVDAVERGVRGLGPSRGTG